MIRKFLTAYALGLVLIYAPLCEAVPFGFWKAASSAAWTPLTPGTLQSWYDTSQLGLVNNASINTFTDSSGHANNLSFSGNPATNKTAQQNGLAAALFTTTPTTFYGTGGASAQTYPVTIIGVVNVSSLAASSTIIGPSATGGIELYLTTAGKLECDINSVSVVGVSTGAITAGSYHLVELVLTSSTYAFYIDGVASGSGSNATATSGSSTWWLGAQASGPAIMNGFIGEVEVYTSALSAGDLSSLHTYIAGKWATP